MKKAFIQKLSIAMASALVITAAAPASADAAAAMKMNKTAKTLYLNSDNMTNTSDTYDFSIKNKPTNYKTKYSFKWYADDESIVDVAKGGVVTAKKVGTTTVKCEITKKSTGKPVDTLEATVTVKANAETVTINNAPENGEIAVGTTFDFNRTMKAANGGKATDKTEWFVFADKDGNEAVDAAVASIDAKGNFAANVPGTYYIVAKTYQSAATKDIDYTAESDAYEVTVYASVTEAKNVTTNTIELTFDADMSEKVNKDNISVKNANGVTQVVNKVTFANDGKTAKVELYTPLTNNVKYTVTAGTLKTVEFTASVGAVASIVVNGPSVVADGEPADLSYSVYDANGVKVGKSNSAWVEFKSDSTEGHWINTATADGIPEITIFTIGSVVPVYAVYHTGTYDLTTGNEITIKSEAFAVTCVDSVAATVTGAPVVTISDKTAGSAADWTNIKTTIAKDKTGYLQVKYTKTDNKTYYTDATTDDGWTFESTDTSKLIVDTTTGNLVPVAEGSVVVLVKNGDTIVTTVTITVQPSTAAASISADATTVTLTNSGTINDTKKVTVKLFDQYGAEYDSNATSKGLTVTALGTDGVAHSISGKEVTFSGAGMTKGTYNYKLTRDNKSVIVTVNVQEAATTVNYAKVKVDKTSYDMKIASGATLTNSPINVNIVKVATNGVEKDVLTASNIVLTVKNTTTGKTYDQASGHVTFNGDGTAVINPVIEVGGKYQKMEAGTYTITAQTQEGTNLYNYYLEGTDKKNLVAGSFTLTNSQATTTVNQKAVTLEAAAGELVDDATLKTKLAPCFELVDNNNGARTFTINKIKKSTTADLTAKGTYDVLVENVVMSETFDGVTLETTIAVNKVVKVTVK